MWAKPGWPERLLILGPPSEKFAIRYVQAYPKEARTPRKGRGAKTQRVPNHNSKTVLSTVHVGGAIGSYPVRWTKRHL